MSTANRSRSSPDGRALIYAVFSDRADALIIRDVATEIETTLVDTVELRGRASPRPVISRGVDWADNSTVLLLGTLLTLESA